VRKRGKIDKGQRTRREQKGDRSAADTRLPLTAAGQHTHPTWTTWRSGLLAQYEGTLVNWEEGDCLGAGRYLVAGRNIWGMRVPPCRGSYLSVTPSKTGTAREWIQGSPGWCGSKSGPGIEIEYSPSFRPKAGTCLLASMFITSPPCAPINQPMLFAC